MLNSDMTQRHLTDAAKRVMRDVSDRASHRGMHSGELTSNTAEMLAILTMLRWEQKVGKAAIERVVTHGADYDALARELDQAIDEEGERSHNPSSRKTRTLPSGQLALVVDYTTPCLRILEQAEHEALDMGRDYVGTEHLMLAAIRLACPALQEILRRHGVSHQNVRRAVVDILTEGVG